MDKVTNVLYLSYDGMTDPLGQSQVIPYLSGLAKLGYRFTLISFEKPERFEKHSGEISALLSSCNIEWHPLQYTKRPPVLSTMYDLWRMKRLARKLHNEKKFRIVHCRSYITALAGEEMKRKFGIKFLFDMRGFYADERVEGGIWNLSNPLISTVYQYFKKKETQFFSEADYSVSLTSNGRNEIHTWKQVKGQPVRIEVIPCCADLKKFATQNITKQQQLNLKKSLGISEGTFVLTYLGSVGTWYMLPEMMDYFKELLTVKPDSVFLFITGDEESHIRAVAEEKGISQKKVIIKSAKHNEVPSYLSLSDWSIFFIKPVYSKKASSPTKQGEIMGMGIPHICNGGVGDVDDILKGGEYGICLSELNAKSYRSAIQRMLQTNLSSEKIRAKAEEFYSLESGVKKYAAIYAKLISE